MIRRILVIAAFVLAALGVLAIRVVVEGRRAIAAGDEAAAAGNQLAAIDAYETAARWYFPLAPHVDDAYAKLRALAASDDRRTALAAWRAIRSAARATRSLWTPHADDLADADAAIARLSGTDATSATSRSGTDATPATSRSRTPGSASSPTAGSPTPGSGSSAATPTPDDEATRRAWHARRLAVDVRPAIAAAAVAALGILLWLGGVVELVRRGLDRTGTWVRRPAMMAGAAIVVGLLLWFVGLANA